MPITLPIRDAYGSYLQRAAPRLLDRVAVNYLNLIRIPGLTIRMEDYFDVYPHLGPELQLPQAHADFLLDVDLPHEAGRDVLRVRFATTQSAGEDMRAFSPESAVPPGSGSGSAR